MSAYPAGGRPAPRQAPKAALVLGGRTGLLGMSLVKTLEAAGWQALPAGRDDLDLFDPAALDDALVMSGCDAVFNAVAYTAVDKAEDDQDAAYRLNRDLPRLVGQACARRGARLVHFSTDFVFDGRAEHPYAPDSPTGPLSVYGRSKLAGEKELLAVAPPGLIIARTAWLFGPGKTNFVHKILSLAKARAELGVVHDQVGSPTYTPDLARQSLALVEAGAAGIFHLANAGRASWCELAAEAVDIAGLPCRVKAITTADFPTRAARPAYSVLDTSALAAATGLRPRPWVQALREYVLEHAMPELGLGHG